MLFQNNDNDKIIVQKILFFICYFYQLKKIIFKFDYSVWTYLSLRGCQKLSSFFYKKYNNKKYEN